MLSSLRSILFSVVDCYRDFPFSVRYYVQKGLVFFHNFINTGRVILLIRSLIDQYPELYLDELRDWIYFRTGETYAIPTLSCCLHKIGLSVKKVSNQLLFSSPIYAYISFLVRSVRANAGGKWFGKIFVALLC